MADDKTSYVDAYEKLLQVWMLCRQIAQVYSLHKLFLGRARSEKPSEATVIMSNICYDYIVINWAKICGSMREDLHFTNVFSDTCISANMVRDDFLRALNFTDKEYGIYWNHLHALRDQGLAHFDFDEVYKLNPNDQYFDKIPVQCKSIAESVVRVFEEENRRFPQRRCRITAQSDLVLLSDIVKHLKEEWRECPID